MKNSLLVFSFLLAFFAANAQTETPKTNQGPKEASFAKFNELVHNFGTIEYGSEAKCVFTFENVGSMNISIKNVETSCGCTTPGYSQKEVKPGEKGEVSAKFDTTRTGTFSKTVTVTFSDGSKRRLTIKGFVKDEVLQEEHQH